MDASREVARRPLVPALALLGPWLALALIAAFRDGGSSRHGSHDRAVGAILACALALLLPPSGGSSSRGRAARARRPRRTRPLVQPSRSPRSRGRCRLRTRGWTASTSRVRPRRSPAACRLGRSCVARPQAACLVLAAIAVTVAVYAIAQRSFSSEFITASFPRLREPFGYSNALAALFVSGVPAALVLGSRRAIAARAGGAACVAVLSVALILTGSRGGLLAALLTIARAAVLGGAPARARHHARVRRRSRRAGRALRRQPPDLLGRRTAPVRRRRPADRADRGRLHCRARRRARAGDRRRPPRRRRGCARCAPSRAAAAPRAGGTRARGGASRGARSLSSAARGISSRATVRCRTRPGTASSRCRRTSATAGGARPGTRSRCGRSRASARERST